MPADNPLFKSRRLPAEAAYLTLFDKRGKLRTVNIPKGFHIPWVSDTDFLVCLYHWENVRHSDPEDGWGFTYSIRELADKLGVIFPNVQKSLSRLESAGMLVKKSGIRVLFAHPYTLRLYITWHRDGERLPLPDIDREIVTQALDASGAFRPVQRFEPMFPFNYTVEARLPDLAELRAECLSLAARYSPALKTRVSELGIDVDTVWKSVSGKIQDCIQEDTNSYRARYSYPQNENGNFNTVLVEGGVNVSK